VRIMASRLVSNADSRGYCALQGRYGVSNGRSSWRAGLMAGAFELFNHVRPLGRDWLGMSVGLKGNGMAFTRRLLENARWSGSSITEDIDFALDLCRYHNVRVKYVPEAVVTTPMPTTSGQAVVQRSRWESGRTRLLRERGLPIIVEGLRRGNVVQFEAGMDLLMPPLAELAMLLAIWAVVVGLGVSTGALDRQLWMTTVAATSIGLFLYILGGFALAGASPDAYYALLFAPFYAVWKIHLQVGRRLHRRRAVEMAWVRTPRERIGDDPTAQTGTERASRPENRR
jgi:1,2-diacylglycerol 3-beta-glucosyltransferase